MLQNNDEKISSVLFTAILPFLLFFMAYYGFESSYVKLKTMERAPDFMFSSVYAYRVIPNFLTVHITTFLTDFINSNLISLKPFIAKNGTVFYHSIFLINLVFFLGSSVVLNKILKFEPNLFASDPRLRKLLHLLGVFLMVIVQYVPTNCDSIAVFFFLAGIFFSLKYSKSRQSRDLFILVGIIFISTFVRETACLNIAFFAALFFDYRKFSIKNFAFYKEITAVILAFVIPYIGLRMIIPQEGAVAEGFYLVQNFSSPFNLAGLVFGTVVLYFIYQLCGVAERNTFKNFIILSVPYLGMITFVGLFWETRLWLPLLLGVLVISSQNINFIKLK
ncbi:glycosyltransferase family 39 protein [Chryseobacterium caseinilyticum]|uniref:Glycosyltransferase family 39 protein n=1 Tax=Chryseobacterium caseinilyticum TaxID=2771428 RepID=A0ABR8ZFT7_9FLAO|nr:glycosyltransferase family 39 protein [Chryseobacterium caseinilyticum]MBD8083561.1 glycosyltransferase family 39 protein [Chryseobacterium caseinilyticum]